LEVLEHTAKVNPREKPSIMPRTFSFRLNKPKQTSRHVTPRATRETPSFVNEKVKKTVAASVLENPYSILAK